MKLIAKKNEKTRMIHLQLIKKGQSKAKSQLNF